MSRRYARKRDDNEPQIVEALRRVGALVYKLGETGVPDLLVGYHGRWLLLEVKMPGSKLNENQRPFFAETEAAGLPVYVVRAEGDALLALKAELLVGGAL